MDDNSEMNCDELEELEDPYEMLGFTAVYYEETAKMLGEEHPDTLTALNNLAYSFDAVGNRQVALELHEKCYEARVRVLGEEHPDTLGSLSNLAGSYDITGNRQKAAELREKCYEALKRVLGEEHPDTLTSLHNLATGYGNLGNSIGMIFSYAFSAESIIGGGIGTVIMTGLKRGVFSNEAGLGSAPIAAAAAKTNEPARQGLVCMTGTFIDTIVICTMTGLAIVVTGAWEPQLGLQGVDITIEAFSRGLSFLGPQSRVISGFFLMTALTFFAFTTILGWDYYSEKCLEYLVGSKRQWIVKFYRFLYVAVVFVGPYLTVSVVWGLADTFNGLMAFPNLVALVLLSPVVWRVTKDYLARNSASARAKEVDVIRKIRDRVLADGRIDEREAAFLAECLPRFAPKGDSRFAAFADLLAKARADGKITPEESTLIANGIYDLIVAISVHG